MGAPGTSDLGATQDSGSAASTDSHDAVDPIHAAPEHDEASAGRAAEPTDPGPASTTGSGQGGSDPDSQ
jgi:hypothetical protein